MAAIEMEAGTIIVSLTPVWMPMSAVLVNGRRQVRVLDVMGRRRGRQQHPRLQRFNARDAGPPMALGPAHA